MLVQVFVVGAVMSFVGSIPPGTLNVLVLQMGLQKKFKQAMRFALAVALVEYPYAWIAVEFEHWIMSSPQLTKNFQLVGAVVMTSLGIFNIRTTRRPTNFSVKFQESGFVKGLILSLLNPQAIPFWIAVTAYLKMQGWIELNSTWQIHSYVLGTSVGTMVLLTLLATMANRMSDLMNKNRLYQFLPGLVLLVLGIVGFVRYFVHI
ncbi:MAG: LysE family translocator [Cyclobacteriaceae bacterium]|nr:LysE family translocator [Cyclobacteriaceae bacterium]MCX7637385.1 LysE family translocator [Cyclobacteriaceae bacterium]MDW8330085.1 LysE family transporter [Cyclobacteriaceae bacterium]